jgi:hypothetical protein
MIPNNLGDDCTLIDLKPVAAITADGLSSAQDLVAYEGEIILIVDVSAPVAGTNPTMDIALHHADTSGGSYSAVTGGSITQVTDTAASTKISLNRQDLKRFVKLNMDIGGTMSPQYLVSAKILGMKKYQ